MAYTRKRSSGRRRTSYSARRAPARRSSTARRKTSARKTQQHMKLVIEVAPQNPVSRPAAFERMSLVEKPKGKAKL